jgi:DivIVA domain-containing protein
VDQRHIDRIRNPQFPVARRGYDRREVDNFMLELAEWLESRAAEDVGSFAVKRKLEMIGRSTANILTTAEQEAEELRKTAELEVAELTERADAAAQKTRQAAEAHANQRRDNADREADEKLAGATSKARASVEEAQRRRTAIESEIAELAAMRDRVLTDLERLGRELEATVGDHRPATSADLLGALPPRGDRAKRERERGRQPRATEAERPTS